MQKTVKVQQKEKEEEKKYAKIRLYNDKVEQMTKLQKEINDLKQQIIADKRAELKKSDTKKEDDDYNFEKAELDAFASKLAKMAQASSDDAMEKLETSTLLQLSEGEADESLANVEIDDGGSQAEQPLGAGALDDN